MRPFSGSAVPAVPRALLLLLGALAGLLCAARASGEPGAVVSKLDWRGVEALSSDELESHILTTRRSWKPWVQAPAFDEATLREDMRRIARFYRARGYYEASAEYDLAWKPDRSAVCVTVRIVEGEPVRLAALELDLAGDAPLPEADELLADLPLAVDGIFSPLAYAEAREVLLGRMADRAHPAARLEGGAEVDLAAHGAGVRWTLHPGPRVRFGPVRVEGLERASPELVLRELGFREGDDYSQAALADSQRAVYGVGLFQSVAFQSGPPAREAPAQAAPESPEAETWPVEVRVREQPPRRIRLGAGFGTEDLFRGQISWLHRNFLGEARSLEISGRGSSLLLGAQVAFVQPRFVEPELRLESTASFLHETPPAYTANRAGIGLQLSRPLFGRWRGRGGYRLEYADVTEVKSDDADADDLPDEFFLATLPLGLARSTVEDRLDPQGGSLLTFSLEPASFLVGSEVDYLKLHAEGRYYQPLFGSVVAVRLELGAIQPLLGSGREDVPIFERFYAGGSTSVRGFEYQKLGPLDAGGDPQGGLSLVEASAELRFPIWRMFGGVVFLDGGQVFRNAFTLRPGDLRFSTGGGLRIRTPLGPVRVDLGYLINPPDTVDRMRVHLSVGQAF